MTKLPEKDPLKAGDLLNHAHQNQQTARPVPSLQPEPASESDVVEGKVRNAETTPHPAEGATPSAMVPIEPIVLPEITPNRNVIPPQTRTDSGKHKFDRDPNFLTNRIVDIEIAAGLLSPEGRNELQNIALEWAELYKRRAQQMTDQESYAQLHQQWLQSLEFLRTHLGVNREKFLGLVDSALITLKQQDPETYGRMPEKNPIRSFEGIKQAMQTVIPEMFAAILASPSLATDRANLIVNIAKNQWDHQQNLQRTNLAAELKQRQLENQKQINDTKTNHEVQQAQLLAPNKEILGKGEEVKQTLHALKAGRPARILVGATTPALRWPIEAIKEFGSAAVKFATETPFTFLGTAVTVGTLLYGWAEGVSPAILIISIAGFTVGVLVQGITNMKADQIIGKIKEIGKHQS